MQSPRTPSAEPHWSFRPAAPQDLDRILEIHTQSFPDARSADERRTSRTHSPYGPLETLLLAERDGCVLGHAFGFALEVPIGGKWVPTLGVASVAVAPEARGDGLGQALVRELHARARLREQPLAMLYPFQERFYAKLGYASVTPKWRIEASLAAFPRASCPEVGYRMATAADSASLARLREDAALRGLGNVRRGEALWTTLLLHPRRYPVVAYRGDDLLGYALTRLEQPHPGGPTTLVVDEWVATGPDGIRAMLSYFARQAGQVIRIVIDAPFDSGISSQLVDAAIPQPGASADGHRLGTVMAGPMLAVLDPIRALSARGYGARLDVVLALDDAACAIHLHADREGAICTQVDGVPPSAIRMSREVFTQVFFGGFAASALVAGGKLAATPAQCAELAFALGSAPFFNVDAF